MIFKTMKFFSTPYIPLFRHGIQKYLLNKINMPNNISSFVNKNYSSKGVYTTIKFIHENKPMEQVVKVQGWIKTMRKYKKIVFIDLYDGTCNEVLQIIADSKTVTGLSNGCSVDVEGKIIPSSYPNQLLEMQAKNISVIGLCDPEKFPIATKQKLTLDYLRLFLHLRPRTRVFTSILKIRNNATMALHKYFQNNDFYLIHTPVLTSNDAEGCGDIFRVQPLKNIPMKEEPESDDIIPDAAPSSLPNLRDINSRLFDHEIYLTVSSQLHLESIVCGSLPKVYSFGPIFRAENSRTRRHLNEFYMVEAELAFIRHLDHMLQIIEDMIKKTAEEIYRTSIQDFQIIDKYLETNHSENIKNLLKKDFVRISYTDAVALVNKSENPELGKLTWGMNFHRKHELELVKLCGNTPVFLTDFPAEIKAFYMKHNEGQKTVAAVDLIVPRIGELCGGSLREDQLHNLKTRNLENKTGKLDWYLELREFGSVPHGGFGLGFERYLRFLTGVHNIKDTIPFPRWPHHCDM